MSTNHFSFINPPLVQSVIDAALSHGGDFAELFVQHSVMTGASLEEERIREAESGARLGAGIRVIKGERTGYAASDDLSKDTLLAAAEAAGRIADSVSPDRTAKIPAKSIKCQVISPIVQDCESVPLAQKTGLLQRVDQGARAEDSRVIQVIAQYGDVKRDVMICNSDDMWMEDSVQIVRVLVSAIVEG